MKAVKTLKGAVTRARRVAKINAADPTGKRRFISSARRLRTSIDKGGAPIPGSGMRKNSARVIKRAAIKGATIRTGVVAGVGAGGYTLAKKKYNK